MIKGVQGGTPFVFSDSALLLADLTLLLERDPTKR